MLELEIYDLFTKNTNSFLTLEQILYLSDI
jgi:hypothetical protein